MANVPVVNQGKTKFVREYLAEHGDAKRAAINDAWRAAGHKDEISESLVYKMRSQHGLIARQGDTEEATQEAATLTSDSENLTSENKVEEGSAVEEPEVESNDKAPGKAAFVEEILRRDPKANSRAVNQAWSEAGHEGTISDPTFYKVRGRLGAPGEPTSSSSRKPGSPKIPTPPGTKGKTSRTSAITTAASKLSGSSNPIGVADEVEAGIDDLMYMLKDNGGMPEVEAALRAARRLLYRNQGE